MKYHFCGDFAENDVRRPRFEKTAAVSQEISPQWRWTQPNEILFRNGIQFLTYPSITATFSRLEVDGFSYGRIDGMNEE